MHRLVSRLNNQVVAAQFALDTHAAADEPDDWVEEKKRFDEALHQYLGGEQKDLMDRINETGKFDDAIKADMIAALDAFKKQSAF